MDIIYFIFLAKFSVHFDILNNPPNFTFLYYTISLYFLKFLFSF